MNREGTTLSSLALRVTGLIDEVRVYHGNLTAEGIQLHAAKPKDASAAAAKMVLHYTFENGKAF